MLLAALSIVVIPLSVFSVSRSIADWTTARAEAAPHCHPILRVVQQDGRNPPISCLVYVSVRIQAVIQPGASFFFCSLTYNNGF